MVNHPVVMKMHNDNGVLYRTIYDKDPFYGKRRIFIPTTGLNNIERPVEDIIADRIEEVIGDISDAVKSTAEDIARVAEHIETEVHKWLEKRVPVITEAAEETIRELTAGALELLSKE